LKKCQFDIFLTLGPAIAFHNFNDRSQASLLVSLLVEKILKREVRAGLTCSVNPSRWSSGSTVTGIPLGAVARSVLCA
jgi:hypothetical protein